MGFKKYIHQFTRSLGFDFYALKDRVESDEQKLSWIRSLGIKTVVDIGANEGQFAEMIREQFPAAMIYSFEPIPNVYEQLVGNFAQDKKFKAFKFAAGEENTSIDINVNAYSPSSSLLEMNDLHVENFSKTAASVKQAIEVRTLDSVADDMNLAKPLFIKIDTQGYESQVIKGGQSVLSMADVVMIELSYKPLYKGQALFHDIYSSMVALGFEYHGNFEQMLSPVDGAVLQSDGFFIKRQP